MAFPREFPRELPRELPRDFPSEFPYVLRMDYVLHTDCMTLRIIGLRIILGTAYICNRPGIYTEHLFLIERRGVELEMTQIRNEP